MAELNEQTKEAMLSSIRKLHVNLGHPSNANLLRVLKHGGTNQAALDLAKGFSCELCTAQRRPAPPNPATTHRVTEFNAKIGIDVKYFPDWQVNQKIPAVNIADYASRFQIMVPLPGRDTSESIRRALRERWVSWAGVPKGICVDPAATIVADALTVPHKSLQAPRFS